MFFPGTFKVFDFQNLDQQGDPYSLGAYVQESRIAEPTLSVPERTIFRVT